MDAETFSLFDAHNHLQDERLAGVRRQVLDGARASGVTGMLCCGSSEEDWGAVAQLARDEPCVRAAYGLHPWYAASRSVAWFEHLESRLHNPAASVGEIGLDHALEQRNDLDQEFVFLRQLELSRALRRPVSIHCRRAWGRMLDLLRPLGPHPAGMIFHAYSGAAELIPALTALNGHVSFSGSITFPGNKRGRRAAAAVPADHLLVETDAPDICPHGREPPNKPAFLTDVVAALALARGESPAIIAALTAANARRLLGA